MKFLSVIILTTILCFNSTAAASAALCRSIFKEGNPSEQIIRNVMDHQANERLTVKVMELVTKQRQENADTVKGWIESLQSTIEQTPPNVLEHSALMFIYNSRLFAEQPEAQQILERSLELSYRNLSGRSISRDEWKNPLPRNVVEASGETSKVFHEAVFREAAALRPKGFFGRLRDRIRGDNCVTTVTTLLATAGMFFESTRPYSALLIGLAEASLNEHLIHIGIGHANSRMTKAFRRFGRAGQFAEQVTLAHRLHHAIVKQNYGAVVLTPAQKDMAEKTLLKFSQKLVLDRIQEREPNRSVEDIEASPEYVSEVNRIVTATRRGNYGINGTKAGALSMLATNTPWYLLNFALYAATGSEAFLVTANASLTVMTLQSLYSHRYLHIRPSERVQVQTNWLQNLYMKSPFGRLQQRLHFVHHESQYAIEDTKNGAIMAGSVSDRLMFDLDRPTVKNMVDYYFQGFLPGMQRMVND
jgi:hypothetical protein